MTTSLNKNITLSKMLNYNINEIPITLNNIIKKNSKIIIKDEIINEQKKQLVKKKNIYKFMYNSCISKIYQNYKIVTDIEFIIPINFNSNLYIWKECKNYIIKKLHKIGFFTIDNYNIVYISWKNLK